MSDVQTSKILVRTGSTVTLECTCHKDVVQWYHNDNLTRNITLDNITLNLVAKSDDGIYRCVGQQHNVSHDINITAYCKLSRYCYY